MSLYSGVMSPAILRYMAYVAEILTIGLSPYKPSIFILTNPES